jgi:sulfide:quinone oxidoreductase
MEIVIAGGGVAGLEALLGLRAVAGERVGLALVAPEADFTYKPLAVAEPFSQGRAHTVPLDRIAEDTGAEIVRDGLARVDPAAGRIGLTSGTERAYDALLVATGGRMVAGVAGASMWSPFASPELYGGLLRDIDEGYAKRIAVVIPPGAVWPLPGYELALMTAGEARAMGHDDVTVHVVTPEHQPLSLFGEEASGALADELGRAGVELHTGVVGKVEGGALVLEPGGERIDGVRVFAIPRIVGPAIEGLPADEDGFIRTGAGGRVEGCERVWAAGDGIVSPLKFGGLATHQARVAVADIARLAGVSDVPDPGEPVLEGHLMTGGEQRRLGEKAAAPLWWPGAKVTGEHLPRWLAEHGIVGEAPPAVPAGASVRVERPLSHIRGAEAQYLYDLARQFRTDDPAIAALGRRMRSIEQR